MKNVHEQYAAALYELAMEEKKQGEFSDELCFIDSCFDENTDFVKLLDNPMITTEEKVKLLDDVFSSHISEYVLNFVKLLSEQKRIRIFKKCVSEFSALFDEERNIVRATAVSAAPLGDEQIKLIEDRLSKLTNKTAVVENTVDESVLGGVVLRYGSNSIDMSVKSELEKIRKEIFSEAI